MSEFFAKEDALYYPVTEAAMPSILVREELKDESNGQKYLWDCSKNEIFMAEIMALLNSDPPCNTDSVLGLG